MTVKRTLKMNFQYQFSVVSKWKSLKSLQGNCDPTSHQGSVFRLKEKFPHFTTQCSMIKARLDLKPKLDILYLFSHLFPLYWVHICALLKVPSQTVFVSLQMFEGCFHRQNEHKSIIWAKPNHERFCTYQKTLPICGLKPMKVSMGQKLHQDFNKI